MSLLRVDNLEAFYGPVQALRGVSLRVDEGAIVAVLGANGAGKTTLLKAISGVLDPAKGEIVHADAPIGGLACEKVVARGIVHVPEGREVFPLLSVSENLAMGAYTRHDAAEVRRDLDMVMGYFPVLAERRGQMAGTLSGGQQQMLAIGRGLMARPQVMLLDEPSLGLSPLLTQEILGIIARLNAERGVSVLLVEQNAAAALRIASYGYVMELGRIVVDGTAEALMGSKEVQEFYLGARAESKLGRRRWKQRKSWR